MSDVSLRHPERAVRCERAQGRITAAFAFADPVDPPVVVAPVHYILWGTPPEQIPEDLFDNPARMTEFQIRNCERHVAAVDDDFQPYFTPYYGTAVLASAFGCSIRFAHGRDPWVAGPSLKTPADVAKLRLPDPERDGLMPRVLETAAVMRADGSYPVSLTDTQGPLDELISMCGHERLYLWMYDEPGMVRELFEMVGEALIQWVKAQKAVTGEPLDACYGEQGVWVPRPCGVWLAEDEMVSLPGYLYEEFILPCHQRIFREFGGGVLHFCGSGAQHGPALRKLEGLRVVNTGPMGQPENFARMQQAFGDKIPLIYQELAPSCPEPYYRDLLGRISLRGVVLAPCVVDEFALGPNGEYVPSRQDRIATARNVCETLRALARENG